MYNKLLLSLMGIGLFAFAPETIGAAPVRQTKPLHEIVKSWHQGSKTANSLALQPEGLAKGISAQNNNAPSAVWEDVSGMATLSLPDGSFWYYTADYEYKILNQNEIYTDKTISRFEFNFYDGSLNHMGTVKDEIDYGEYEVRVAGFELAEVVTKKFFNYDDKYEIMLSISLNTVAPGINTNSVKVYSIGGEKDENGDDKVIWKIDNMLFADYVNASPDPWGENYYMTFAAEFEDYDNPDYFENYKMALKTFSKATYGDVIAPVAVNEEIITYSHMPGDMENTPCLFSWAEGGRAYFLISQYEKRFFTDPTGATEDDSVIPDNYLLADIYSISFGESSFSLEKSLRIPTVQDEANYLWTFYSIGNLDYTRDVIHNGDDWKFILTKQFLTPENEDTFDSFYLIDDEGNVINTIFELAEGKVRLSDIHGMSTQFVFIIQNGSYSNEGAIGYDFNFVNVPSGELQCVIPSVVREYGLTTTIDRVKGSNGPLYAVVTNTPTVDKDNNVYDRVAWFTSKGKLSRIDNINLGKGVQYSLPYIKSEALSPYYFNTDSKMEYMYLVKRMAPDGKSLNEELMVVNEDGEILLECAPNNLGALRNIITVDNGINSKLQVIYYNAATEKYACEFYPLPLSKFNLGGEGTKDNPYLIGSIGDFHEIGLSPASHYRLANDIDASKYTFNTIPGDFTGSLDGAGYTISNLDVVTSEYEGGIFSRMTSATVKNLNFSNVHVYIGSETGYAGTLVGASVETTIENVNFYGLNVEGNVSLYGGIVGEGYMHTNILGCAVYYAHINAGGSIGGIAGNLRTGSVVKSCLFGGEITGRGEIGGIVGTTISGDETISNNHVDAILNGNVTIGGIAGYSKRSTISNNFVEGELIASGSGRNGACVGGVIGNLEPSFAEKDNICVTNNIVAVSKFEGDSSDDPEKNCIHRIIGFSKTNLDYEPGEARVTEQGLEGNIFIVSSLSLNPLYTDANSTEGEEKLLEDLTQEYLEGKNYLFGENISNPWIFDASGELALFFENNLPEEPSNEPVDDPELPEEPNNPDSGVGSITTGTEIYLKGNTLYAEDCIITVYDIKGQKVAETKDECNVSGLTKGIYIGVAVTSDGERKMIKFAR